MFIISKISKRARSDKGKQLESSSNPFIFQNASHRFSVFHNKHVISGRTVMLADFEHLNLATILNTSSLEHLVTIKEPIYSELVHYFYSNLTFQNNHVRSRVLGKDINISLDRFAHLLHLSCEGVDIYNVCLLYTSPSPRDRQKSRMPSSA